MNAFLLVRVRQHKQRLTVLLAIELPVELAAVLGACKYDPNSYRHL